MILTGLGTVTVYCVRRCSRRMHPNVSCSQPNQRATEYKHSYFGSMMPGRTRLNTLAQSGQASPLNFYSMTTGLRQTHWMTFSGQSLVKRDEYMGTISSSLVPGNGIRP